MSKKMVYEYQNARGFDNHLQQQQSRKRSNTDDEVETTTLLEIDDGIQLTEEVIDAENRDK